MILTFSAAEKFYSAENEHAYMILDHVASGRFDLGRDVHCEFNYWPLECLQQRCACCVKLLYLEDGRHVNAVIMSFDPNKNYEMYESSEIS